MMKERQCTRCSGTEILLLADSGAVVAWRDKSGSQKEWFCPCCDWGDDRIWTATRIK